MIVGMDWRGLLQILNYFSLSEIQSWKIQVEGGKCGFIIIKMQRQDDIFLWVASKVSSTSLLAEILQSQQNSYDIQPYKIEASEGSNMAKMYSAIRSRYQYGAKNDSDPDSWNENERRLFVWFIVCYAHLLEQESRSITEETWKELSPVFFNKKPQFLHFQYLNLLKGKGRVGWSVEEDQLLTRCTQEIKPGKWNAISKKIFYQSGQQVFRTPKHCRERWLNHLDETKKKGEWTNREDFVIFEYALSKGKRWSKMVELLDGTRTEHMIKNRYNSLISKWRGPKKQKEEDVATKILNMLSHAQQDPSQDRPNTQQRNIYQQQDKIQSNEDSISALNMEIVPQPQQVQIPPSMRGNFPFDCYMDYQSFMFYNQLCYEGFRGYAPFGMQGNGQTVLQPSKRSSFSSYKQQKTEI